MSYQTPKEAIKAARTQIVNDLTNAKAYLVKATEEKQKTQARVNELQGILDQFDAWLLANQ